ncbi:hypothetical protein ACKQTC_08435 [Peptococcus simiae]|uniref:Hint domain-containing protein n=1 Tax=Peptococcus simiae TaxID=1643805 RepID=A0ABW9H2D4_9FIRM
MLFVGNFLRPTDISSKKPAEELVQIDYVPVKSVTFVGRDDVYNLEVQEHNNFAVNGGYIVHNCIDATRYSLERHIRGANFKLKGKR